MGICELLLGERSLDSEDMEYIPTKINQGYLPYQAV